MYVLYHECVRLSRSFCEFSAAYIYKFGKKIYIGAAGFLLGNNAPQIQNALKKHYPQIKIKCSTDILNAIGGCDGVFGRGMQWQGMSLWITLRHPTTPWFTSTYMPTLPGRLFFLEELAGPLVAECN